MIGVERIRRFFRRRRRKNKNFTARRGFDGDPDAYLLTIPVSLWTGHVFAYLDRHSQNKLCIASKPIYKEVKEIGINQPWPTGKVRTNKKIILSVAFSPSGSELAIVKANSKTIDIWRRQSGFNQSLQGHKGVCSDVCYAPSNGFLVSCSRTDGSVRLWRKSDDDHDDYDNNGLYFNFGILNVQVFATLFVRVSSNSEEIASFGDDGKIYVSNAKDGMLVASTLWRSRLFIDCYDCVAFPSKRSGMLAHTFNNQTVRLWDYRTRSSMELEDNDQTRIRDYAAYITSIQFVKMKEDENDSKQEYLAVGCRVATVKIWDLEDYSCIYTIFLGSGWSAVTHLVFNNEANRIACTGGGSNIRLFQFPSGECIDRIEDHKDRINTLAFTPDGKVLGSGSSDRSLRLWCVS